MGEEAADKAKPAKAKAATQKDAGDEDRPRRTLASAHVHGLVCWCRVFLPSVIRSCVGSSGGPTNRGLAAAAVSGDVSRTRCLACLLNCMSSARQPVQRLVCIVLGT